MCNVFSLELIYFLFFSIKSRTFFSLIRCCLPSIIIQRTSSLLLTFLLRTIQSERSKRKKEIERGRQGLSTPKAGDWRGEREVGGSLPWLAICWLSAAGYASIAKATASSRMVFSMRRFFWILIPSSFSHSTEPRGMSLSVWAAQSLSLGWWHQSHASANGPL